MKLLIYNNTSRFSTVLDAFLKEAQKSFERIYVIFPRKYDAEKAYGKYENVIFITPTIKNWIEAGGISILNLFQKNSCADYLLAIKTGKFNIRFIKTYIRSTCMSNLLYTASISIVKKLRDDIAVFSTWYDINAIAAAKVAVKYPNIFVASYAHSYEVDFRKNPFTVVVGDRFKEKYIDEIYFISKKVMDEYIALNKETLLHTDKYKAVHFGSRKKREGLANYSNDNIFRIVTCSGLSPVKRLDILANALTLYKGEKKIEWTIIGDGPDKGKIKAIADKVNREKVYIIFKGNLTNELVHDYYANNLVDLFINISSSEGLPVAIMEAMSYGIPALATDAGGNHEIVTDETGYPIAVQITAKSLCNQITLIIENAELCFLKRKAAFNMWNENYRIDKNITIVLERLKNGR